jgi:hypothetical protein
MAVGNPHYIGGNAFLAVLSEDGGWISTLGRENLCCDHLGQMLRFLPMGTGFQFFPGSISRISSNLGNRFRSMGTTAPVMNEDLSEASKRAGFAVVSGLAAGEGISYNRPIVPPLVPEECDG